MRQTDHGQNWSALIPIKVLKEKLKVDEGSFVTQATSKFTFIRKTNSYIFPDTNVFDINLMPPMIVKNCLPFGMVISCRDSSNV